MSDMNIERRRLSQQMRQDLSELKFSAAMRESVLARVRAEEAAHPSDLAGPLPLTRAALHGEELRNGAASMRQDGRPDLRAVPSIATTGRKRREAPLWQRAGVWMAGGTVAAAAVVIGIVLSAPSPGSALPEQRLAALPDTAGGSEEFVMMSFAEESGEHSGDKMMMAALAESDPDPDGAVGDGDGSGDPDGTAVHMTAAVDDPADAPGDQGDAPGEVPFTATAAGPEDPRPGAGVAAQPGTRNRQSGTGESTARQSDADPSGSGNQASSLTDKDRSARTTLKDLNKEAELVVLAQVKNLKGSDLTLSPVQALKGKLPKGDLTVTMPAGEKSLSKRELVVVFLRQAESAKKDQGKKPSGKLAVRWRLVGGMAGIFRIDGDQVESQDGKIDLDALKDEVR